MAACAAVFLAAPLVNAAPLAVIALVAFAVLGVWLLVAVTFDSWEWPPDPPVDLALPAHVRRWTPERRQLEWRRAVDWERQFWDLDQH